MSRTMRPPALVDFQRNCLSAEKKRQAELDTAKKIAEEAEEKLMHDWNYLKAEQDKYGDCYKPVSYLGGLKYKCACCAHTLVKDLIKTDGVYDWEIVFCPECGYRFARVMRSSSDL